MRFLNPLLLVIWVSVYQPPVETPRVYQWQQRIQSQGLNYWPHAQSGWVYKSPEYYNGGMTPYSLPAKSTKRITTAP